jgi:hypothetical protein
MSELIACPFCHELFVKGEVTECRACGLPLTDLSKLPMSHDAMAEEDFGLPTPPHLKPLSWLDMRRGKGTLVIVAALGLVTFFGPWVDMTSPETRLILGFELARRSGWIWGAGVAWFVLLPMALTRRSIDKLRGARVAAAFLSAVPVVTCSILWFLPPHSRFVPLRFEWAWGFYSTWVLGVVALVTAIRLGGKWAEMEGAPAAPPPEPRTLH